MSDKLLTLLQAADFVQRVLNGLVQHHNVDGFRDEINRANVHRLPDVGHIIIGRHDNGFERFEAVIRIGVLMNNVQHLQAIHPGHLDIHHHHVNVGMGVQDPQALLAIPSKQKPIGSGSDRLSELQREHGFGIRFVVNH